MIAIIPNPFNGISKPNCHYSLIELLFQHESQHVIRQHVLTYSALLKLCTDELMDCKSQITQLTTQVNHIFSTLDHTSSTHAKGGIIHSLFNFLFGNPNSLAEINSIKINMAILEEKQDVLSN